MWESFGKKGQREEEENKRKKGKEKERKKGIVRSEGLFLSRQNPERIEREREKQKSEQDSDV